MNKWIGIPLVVIGLVALGCALFFATQILMPASEALAQLTSSDPSLLALGYDQSTLQSLSQQLGSLLAIGWIWTLSSILAGAFCIYAGVQMLRKKK